MNRVRFFLISLLLLATAASASAQDRSRSGRARMELGLEHGVGMGNWGFFEAVADLRLYLPEGLGVVLRTGGAGMPFAGSALFVEPGVAARVDLLALDHIGLQLAFSGGATIGRADVHGDERLLYGVFGGVHLDFWHRNAFVGIGAVARYAWTELDENSPTSVAGELWSITPMIRIGGEWGL